MRARSITVAIAAVLLTVACPSAAKVVALHYFPSGNDDGNTPGAGLFADAQGNLFGTTQYGGNVPCAGVGCGTIYETSHAGHGWTTRVIYNFADQGDGKYPQSPLALDSGGALYGTSGSVLDTFLFRLNPDGSQWDFATLVHFPTTNQILTSAPVLFRDNSVYGLTIEGNGTLFRASPPQGGGTPWTVETPFSFPGGDGGSGPVWLAADTALGNVYAVTSDGNGAVVELTPGDPWRETVLYRFQGSVDGYSPNFVMLGSDGALYGTARGGKHQHAFGFGGIVFKLAPPHGRGTGWKKTTLYNFAGWPPISLSEAPGGALTGVVFGDLDIGAGYAFLLSPPGEGAHGWTLTRAGGFRHVYSRNPLNVVTGRDGRLYGALNGGDTGVGAVFEIK